MQYTRQRQYGTLVVVECTRYPGSNDISIICACYIPGLNHLPSIFIKVIIRAHIMLRRAGNNGQRAIYSHHRADIRRHQIARRHAIGPFRHDGGGVIGLWFVGPGGMRQFMTQGLIPCGLRDALVMQWRVIHNPAPVQQIVDAVIRRRCPHRHDIAVHQYARHRRAINIG